MKNTKDEQGFMLISVIILMSLALIIAGGIATSTRTEAKIHSTTNEQVKNYSVVEETMARTVAWLQDNEKNIVSAFTAANFTNPVSYTHLTLPTTPYV